MADRAELTVSRSDGDYMSIFICCRGGKIIIIDVPIP